MAEFKTLDSGSREEYPTGARRDTQAGKPRYDLVGVHGVRRLAELMARGAEKYGERNWEKGQPVSRYYASAFRHLMQWVMGDKTEDHLAAVAFNVFGIMHVEEESKTRKEFAPLLDMDMYRTPEQPLENIFTYFMSRIGEWVTEREVQNHFAHVDPGVIRTMLTRHVTDGTLIYDSSSRSYKYTVA